MEMSKESFGNIEIPTYSETNTETEDTETVNGAQTDQPEENAKSADNTETAQPEETKESVDNTETDQPAETEETQETDQSAETEETQETAEIMQDPETIVTAEKMSTTTAPPKTKESTVIPTPTPGPKEGPSGSWGTVVLIILLIIAAGAALAVILLRRKNKGMKSLYQQNAYNNPTVAIDRDLPSASVSCGMAQTIGKRGQQQDSLYCSNWQDPGVLLTRGLLAAVADGIGGLEDGNLASMNAMQAIRATFLEGSSGDPPSDRLLACAAAAQKSVVKLNETSSCGSTLVSVLITGGTMYLLSIGDSRIYLYRAGALLQLNREHILRRENEEKEALYGTGEILTRKRAGALTSYLGKSNLTQIDRTLQPMKLLPGDRIALMSDGVFNVLSEQEIMNHLRKNPEAAAREMIQDVDLHDHPSQDNATVVVIGIG